MLFSPIHHTFAPHVDAAYAWKTLMILLQPRKWQKGEEEEKLRLAIAELFQADATLFASGREALLALFQSMNIGKGDEVIIQSYTCLVVPNAIAASGATPIYADIDPETLNLTPETVESVISNRTKAVICQHTFGIPADTERLRELSDQYELTLIEDCAHIIPDTKGPKEIGQYGDYLILSFGRDKAISGITGGALIIKNKEMCCHPGTSAGRPSWLAACHGEVRMARSGMSHEPYTLLAPQGDIALLPHVQIFRLLLYPLFYSLARPLYGIGIGKLLLWLSSKLGLLIPIVTRKEKDGQMDSTLHTIPNACAALALTQLKKLQQINDHRRTLTKLYLQAFKDRGWRVLEGITADLPLQKFPMFIHSPTKLPLPAGEGEASAASEGEGLPNTDYLRSLLKHRNIHLSDGWTGCTICPPSAEEIAASILSIPTHPTMTIRQAQILIKNLERILTNNVP